MHTWNQLSSIASDTDFPNTVKKPVIQIYDHYDELINYSKNKLYAFKNREVRISHCNEHVQFSF